MISILTVNWCSYDFLSLLLESLDIYSTKPFEVIVVDNSLSPQVVNHTRVQQLIQKENIGHGAGLNLGFQYNFKYDHVLVLDVDCHILRKGWEDALFEELGDNEMIGGRGVPAKPLRPAIMFMKSYLGKLYDWRPTDGYKGHRVTPDGYDVGILAYNTMKHSKVNVKLIESVPSHYKTVSGEDWIISGVPTIYHHWHGTHIKERQIDFPDVNLQDNKSNLMSKIPWRSIPLF